MTEDNAKIEQERVRLFNELLEATGDGYFVYSDERFVLANPGLLNIVGLEQQPEAGLGLHDFLPADEAERARRIIQALVVAPQKEPSSEPIELLGHREDGPFVIEVVAVPTTWRGKPAVQGIVRDVTQRRKMEETIRRLERAHASSRVANALAQDMDRILSNVQSHLATLRNNSDLPPNHRAATDRMHAALVEGVEAVDRVQRLTQHSLDGPTDLAPGSMLSMDSLDEEQEGDSWTNASRSGSSTSPGTGGPRVLVIVDPQDLAEVLSGALKDQGWQTSIATTGHRALSQLRTESWDLALVELGMPDLSGWELATAAKEIDPKLPIILMTGWASQTDDSKLASSGVDRLLTKPFSSSQLVDLVMDLLS